MQIIASNENQVKASLKKHWGFWSKSLAVTSFLVMVIAFLPVLPGFLYYLLIPLFTFLLLSIVLSLNEWIKGHPSPFCAYADNGCLYINFEVENTDRFKSRSASIKEPRNYCFPFGQIVGYKLHVLFKTPSALEIQLNENRPEILNMIIPLNSVGKEEAQKLVAFLEQIIPHQTISEQNRLT